MEELKKIYDEHENVIVRFAGFETELSRYDFAIVYTNIFYTKPLVICMQTGRSTLLDYNDLEDPKYLQKNFKIEIAYQAEDLIYFFKEAIPGNPFSKSFLG